MRIIAGTFKGKIIKAPHTLPVRPTTDFAKTALFNMVENQFHLSSCTILDLYAGTGNISYEFISRGAEQVICIDQNNHCIQFISATAQSLKAANLLPQRVECEKYLRETALKYDIIFADPPYEHTPFEKLVELVFSRSLLKSGGWFILEHSSKLEVPVKIHWKETRIYGAVAFSIFVQ